jgi:hypothetical protein
MDKVIFFCLDVFPVFSAMLNIAKFFVVNHNFMRRGVGSTVETSGERM